MQVPENLDRSDWDEAVMNPSVGGFKKLDMERNVSVVSAIDATDRLNIY